VHADLFTPDVTHGHYRRHVKDFYIKDFSEGVIPNHKSLNWAPEQPLEARTPAQATTFRGGSGRWRIEVEPASPAKTDHFLNAMQPSLTPGTTLPAMERIETPEAFGAVVRHNGQTYRVTFSKNSLEAPAVERK
jgi:hypothetical protein